MKTGFLKYLCIAALAGVMTVGGSAKAWAVCGGTNEPICCEYGTNCTPPGGPELCAKKKDAVGTTRYRCCDSSTKQWKACNVNGRIFDGEEVEDIDDILEGVGIVL